VPVPGVPSGGQALSVRWGRYERVNPGLALSAPSMDELLAMLRVSAPPRLRSRSMPTDAYQLLSYLRDCTGRWCTMWELRTVLGANPVGLGEPVVSAGLRAIRERGIHVEEAIHWVEYPPPRSASPLPVVHVADPLVDPTPMQHWPEAELLRETVWRLP
jgi:hypothetical protein